MAWRSVVFVPGASGASSDIVTLPDLSAQKPYTCCGASRFASTPWGPLSPISVSAAGGLCSEKACTGVPYCSRHESFGMSPVESTKGTR